MYWEPFDFGLRKANVEIAERARRRAESEVSVTKLKRASDEIREGTAIKQRSLAVAA